MIRPEELRKDNLVYEICRSTEVHLPYFYPLKIVSIEISHVKVILPSENLCHIECPRKIGYSDISPIELTEERLIELGFEKKHRLDSPLGKSTHVWALYSFTLTIWDDERLFYDWIGGNIEVKHIHHLQNIYSDLLRKELAIK